MIPGVIVKAEKKMNGTRSVKRRGNAGEPPGKVAPERRCTDCRRVIRWEEDKCFDCLAARRWAQ